uniref:Uncharacterized protein MANES_09G082900 n=1 Tax=Rhizophora mucronata TaxID=61149 RepID=A0A2P2P154_RHIMU
MVGYDLCLWIGFYCYSSHRSHSSNYQSATWI